MRTTNKAFKELVRVHIIERLDSSNYTSEKTTLKEELEIVVNEFENWYCFHEKKRMPNKYTAFKDWLMGLPSCFNVEYENWTVHECMKDFFEKTIGEYRESEPSSKEFELYLHLITREFEALCKLNKVDF